jgi:hypothetical protein
MKTLLQITYRTKMLWLATALLASLASIGAAIQHWETKHELAQKQAQQRQDEDVNALKSGFDGVRMSHPKNKPSK